MRVKKANQSYQVLYLTELYSDYSFYLQNGKGQDLPPIKHCPGKWKTKPAKSRHEGVFSLVAIYGVPLVGRHLFEPEEKTLFHFEGYLLLKFSRPVNILPLRPTKPLFIPFQLGL